MPELDPQPLRIKPPALDEGGEEGAVFAPRRHLQFLLGGDLHVVAGHRFMDGQRRQFPQRALIEVRRVDVIIAGQPRVRASGW